MILINRLAVVMLLCLVAFCLSGCVKWGYDDPWGHHYHSVQLEQWHKPPMR